MHKWLCVLFLNLGLIGCATDNNYAPVVELASAEPVPHSGQYQVKTGETLYSIAWRFGMDYRTLAQQNKIAEPYTIQVGQALILKNQKSEMAANQQASKILPSAPDIPISFTHHFILPAQGQVQKFSSEHKGINIVGKQGAPIYATAAGKVVYAGDGLRGYGNLIIIKHSNVYLSAYAHNKLITVKEGQIVKQGQKIAEMGSTGTDHTMLHFEIRRAGKPIDPLSMMG